MAIKQGNIYWVSLEDTEGETSGFVHPHVVIQDDVITQSRINTVVVCALTTNMKKVNDPGNVLLDVGEADLPKQSIVVVSQVSTVKKSQLGEYIGALSPQRVDEIFSGMRFLQSMSRHQKDIRKEE